MNAPAEKPFEVVSVLDPAIDTESMLFADMLKYRDTRDIKLLKFKPGRQPQRYYLREVKDRVWESYVAAGGFDEETGRPTPLTCLRAFMCAVVRVDNILQRDGSILPGAWVPSGMPDAVCIQDADVERFSKSDRAEIGAIAFTRSFLAPRTAETYPLSPTLRRSMVEREYLRADATPPSPAPSNGEASSAQAEPSTPPSGSTQPTPSSCANGTADPTVATAPAPAMEAASSP